MPQITIDASRAPLVKVMYPDMFTMEDYEDLFARYATLCEQHKRIAWLIDFRSFNPLTAPPKIRQAAASIFERYRNVLSRATVCEGRAVESSLARGVLTAFDWMTGNKWPCRNFATVAEAEAFCRQQLVREGLSAGQAQPRG